MSREKTVTIEQITDEAGKCPIKASKGNGPKIHGVAIFNKTWRSFTLFGRTYRRIKGHWSNATHICLEDKNYYRLWERSA